MTPQEAIERIHVLDSALADIDMKLHRMRELAIHAAAGSSTDAGRAYLDVEFQRIKKEINDISLHVESLIDAMPDETVV